MKADGIDLRPYEPEDAGPCARVFERAWNAGHPYAPRAIGVEEFLQAVRDRSVVVARTEAGRVVGGSVGALVGREPEAEGAADRAAEAGAEPERVYA